MLQKMSIQKATEGFDVILNTPVDGTVSCVSEAATIMIT